MVPDQRPRGGRYMGSVENMEVKRLCSVWKKVHGARLGKTYMGRMERCMCNLAGKYGKAKGRLGWVGAYYSQPLLGSVVLTGSMMVWHAGSGKHGNGVHVARNPRHVVLCSAQGGRP